MIIVPLYPGQGLGNQLWVYAAGRSIAEQTGRGFRLIGYEHFKGTDFLEIETDIAGKKPQSKTSESDVTVYHERQFYDAELNCVAAGFDDNITRLKGNSRLEGLFQDERYFFGDPARLARYIIPNKEVTASHPIASDVCVLNIRGGEYKHHPDLLLKKTYWQNAMTNMRQMADIKSFMIVTDDRAYARSLFPDLPIVSGDVGACFMSVLNAKNVILSNSSFGYFPTKLSEKQNVIAPLHWARPDNPYDRWAVPANLYKDWLWQSSDGQFHDYEKLLTMRDETERDYIARCTLLIAPKDLPARGWHRFVPKSVRQSAKAFLSRLMPSRFG